MKDPFVYAVRRFLEQSLLPSSKIVLALSGGPDSTALLEIIYEIRDRFLLEMHIAHVDHGWREESRIEADILRKNAEKKGVHFHFKKLNLSGSSNLEDRSREERYSFFQEVYEKVDASALILGHHKDDLAETVLKRIFEGAHLENLGGMRKSGIIRNLKVLRPLLDYEKQEIIDWLEARNISYFIDKTNQDPHFLRTRLRNDLIPLLEKHFGKKIKNNLVQLSKRAYRLKDYLESKESFGAYELDIEYILMKASKQHQVGLSQEECDLLIKALLHKKRVQVVRKEGTWIASRGEIFILGKTKSLDSVKVILKI